MTITPSQRLTDQEMASGGDTSPEDMALMAEAGSIPVFHEIGSTGLKRSAGYLDEEFLPQLRGRKAVGVYREMSENDPIVGALLFAITKLLGQVEWRVEPAGKGKDAAEAAKLVETSMDDMNVPWSEFIMEAATHLIYGWAWHEIVYKRRTGPWERNPRLRSKYTDGKIGWRKMPIRSQETLLRWLFDDEGDTIGMVQMAPPRYQTNVIPLNRSLLFRHGTYKGSPEGRSMLRNAYRPWFMKKRLEEIEAVGIERDLAGLPIVHVPADMLRAKVGSDQHKQVAEFKKMVKSVRRNEQEGMVFPRAYDQDTNGLLYEFELLGGGGSRAFNIDGTIKRYEERILMTVLADWMLVGHQETGSYSMHLDKTGMFRTSLNSVAQSMAEVMNRHAIPRLFMVNGWKPAELPKIVPSDVDAPDLTQLGQFMSSMAGLGIQWFPDPVMEQFVRQTARLPELTDDAEERRRMMQMRSEATQFSQANSQYLLARQQEAMGGLDPQAMAQQQMQGQQQAAGGGAAGGAKPAAKKPAAKASAKPAPKAKP